MKKSLCCLALLSIFSTNALAADSTSGTWTIRTGVANVSPNDSSGNVLSTTDGVTVDSATGLGLSLTYHVDSNWGIEVLAASPFSHKITGTGTLAGLKIGETKQLPPTVSALYHFGEKKNFHFGVGVNHTQFFDSNTTADLTTALGATKTDIDLSSSTGLAAKFGMDFPVSKDWNINANIYWADIDTKADVIVDGAVATTVDVEIDPWVFMVGVSTSF